MFSVDNFYNFFQSHYGWHKTNIMSWIFCPHGSRDINDTVPLYESKELPVDWDRWPLDAKISKIIIMHDQEPFFKDHCLHTYRKFNVPVEKRDPWDPTTPEEIFLSHWVTCYWPIVCHSEVNSPDIDWLKSVGGVDCYYFWHGLIARDWFRHWRHHPDLQQQNDWKKRFLLYIRDCTGLREYRNEVKKRLSDLRDQIECDWEGDQSISSDYSAKIVVDDAVNTAIHIVAETVFGPDKVHLTEKIFKPMVMRQPFIVFAGPGSLKYLKSYGFQTFGDIWDESYDDIADPQERLDKIIALIARLHDLPEHEFKDIIDRCQSIVDYNRRRFFSDDFENMILEELHRNMESAISAQQMREDTSPGGSFFYAIDLMKNNNVLLNGRSSRVRILIKEIQQSNQSLYQRLCERYPWVKGTN